MMIYHPGRRCRRGAVAATGADATVFGLRTKLGVPFRSRGPGVHARGKDIDASGAGGHDGQQRMYHKTKFADLWGRHVAYVVSFLLVIFLVIFQTHGFLSAW